MEDLRITPAAQTRYCFYGTTLREANNKRLVLVVYYQRAKKGGFLKVKAAARSLLASLLLLYIFSLSTPSFAQHGPPAYGYNYHVLWEYDLAYYNSFDYVSTGSMSSTFPSDPNSFTNIEQWRGDANSYYTWTEIGWTNGELKNTYRNGFFGAYNQGGYYVEFPIGPQNGQAISNSGLSVWSGNVVAFVYGGQAQRLVTTAAAYSDNMQVGIESNSSRPAFNYFLNGSNNSVMQTYAGGPRWYMWPTSPIYLFTYNDSPRNTPVHGYYVDYPNAQVHANWYWP